MMRQTATEWQAEKTERATAETAAAATNEAATKKVGAAGKMGGGRND
jgi:hypothetical protein